MKVNRKYGYLVAIVLTGALMGIAFATVVNKDPNGVHELTVSSSTNTVDTGLGIFTLNNDSTIRNALFLSNAKFQDTFLAIPGTINALGGTAKILTGKAASSLNTTSTFYVQMSDTARTTISTTFTDSATSSGSWSSSFTSNSGTCTSKFGYGGGRFSSTAISFGDSTGAISQTGQSFSISNAMRSGDSVTVAANPVETQIAVTVRSAVDSNVGDTMRIIIISPSGKIVGDSQMSRSAGPASTDTTWVSPRARFETGVNTVVVIYWDGGQSKYMFKTGRINVATVDNAVTGGGGTFSLVVTNSAPAVGQLSRIDITLYPSTPTVATVQILDPTGDGAPKSDNYALVDTNTTSFDTRLASTVFSINLFDAGGNPITAVSGAQFLIVLKYNFGNLTASQVANTKLLHRNAQTNAWEVVSNSTADSASGTLVAYVSNFSDFAMGNVTSSSAPPPPSNNNCVITSAIGGTGLAGIMPALRGTRDALMETSIGRLITSGYYSVASGILLALALGGFGVFTARRRS